MTRIPGDDKLAAVLGLVMIAVWLVTLWSWANMKALVVERDRHIAELMQEMDQRQLRVIMDKSCFNQLNNTEKLHMMLQVYKK